MITTIQHRPLADLLRWEALQKGGHHLHTVCAWCLPGTAVAGEPTSHGICPRCRAHVERRFADLRRPS